MGTVADPALLVGAEAGADAGAAGRALAAGFVTAPEALAELAAADPVARIAARFPGVGPVLQPDLLTAVVRSISAQQITLRFAAVLRGRLARRYGHRHQVPVPPDPAAPAGEVWSLDAGRLAGAEVADLRELQFSTAKAVAVVAFAGAVAARRVDLGTWPGWRTRRWWSGWSPSPGSGAGRPSGCWPGPWAGPGWWPATSGSARRSGPPTWTAACRRRPRWAAVRPLGRRRRGRPAAAAALAVGRGYCDEERDPARAVVTPRLIRTPPETSRDALATPGRRRSQPAPVEASRRRRRR